MSDVMKFTMLLCLMGIACLMAVAALEVGARLSYHYENQIRDSMIEKYENNPVTTIVPGDIMERRGAGGTW